MRTTFLSLAFVVASVLSTAAQPVATNCPRSGSGITPGPAVVAARRAEHQVCAADMARLCGNVPRECGRPMQCLRAHAGQVSSTCAGAMAQLRAARMQAH